MVGGPIKQFIKNLILCPIYSLGNNTFKILNSKSNKDDLAKIIQLVSQSKIKPVISSIVPFNEGIDAFKTFQKGHSKGKIVVQISLDSIK
jgi:NADPH:quinone reductase-like Zn-dependent oxidoreductase